MAVPETESRQLTCLIEGESIVFPVRAVGCDCLVSDLKKAIKAERALDTLKDPHTLELWKPNEFNTIVAIPANTLAERIRSLGDNLLKFADKLEPMAGLFSIFPNQPPSEHLHIIVKVPATDQRSLKRAHSDREDSAPPEDVVSFWRDLWVERKSPFHAERCDDNVEGANVPGTMPVIRGLPRSFRAGAIMVRDEYKLALGDLTTLRDIMNGVVIVGHPGIGKTFFLFYLLIHRLMSQQPTILQLDRYSIYFFYKDGVRFLSHNHLDSFVDVKSTWALLDAKEDHIAPVLLWESDPIFLVIASSPQPSHWRDARHYITPIRTWFMEPFSLQELIQASRLQKFRRSESSIREFFENFGPSARDCYASCDEIPYYLESVRNKVQSMGWAAITKALSFDAENISLEVGSHKILLVSPTPADRSHSLTNVVTKTVSQILHEVDSDARWANARILYRTLQADPFSKATAGKLFEPAFHALCVRGASFSLFPMERKPGGHVNDTYTNTCTESCQTLTLPPQQRFVFDEKQPIESLLENHYYEPRHGTQPSYDSFIFDPEECRFTLFQVTEGLTHPVKQKGINALLSLAERLDIQTPKLRFVAVVSEGLAVDFVVPMERGFDLEMFSLEVTEGELYEFS